MALDAVDKVFGHNFPAYTVRKCRIIDEVHPGLDTNVIDETIVRDLGEVSGEIACNLVGPCQVLEAV